MGQEIDSEEFEPGATERFARQLKLDLKTLQELLSTPGFGQGEPSLGAELEMSFVDVYGRPALLNQALLERLQDDAFTLEVNRFNLEYNAPPTPFAGRPFSALGASLSDAVARAGAAAMSLNAQLVTVGIVPTLLRSDLGSHALSNNTRYRVLERELKKRRGAPFQIRIDGAEPLSVDSEHVTYEGANTSLQLHLRVAPSDFARTYNAAQLATAPALALSGNSPFFLEHRLWEETRIALFKQSVDDRQQSYATSGRVSRVGFGTSWIDHPHDLFDESVRRHAPLLPFLSRESVSAASNAPPLAALRLHHGTVWTWNRAIYDPVDTGHLRIELRALPSGPTVMDMLANGAFLIGLTLGLAKSEPACAERLAFCWAHDNFYRAAQEGLRAILTWPGGAGPVRCKASDLLVELIPIAETALLDAGVAPEETRELMGIVRARIRTGQTGAQWQSQFLEQREDAGFARREALEQLLQVYIAHSTQGEPVHGWPLDYP